MLQSAYLPVVKPLTLTDHELRFYREEGYLPIPGFVDAAALPGLCQEVYDVLAAHGLPRERLGRTEDTKDKLRQFPQYLRGSRLDSLINSPSTMAVAAQLIGGRAVRYLPFTAVKTGGGGGQFHFHQDNNYTWHEPALGSINIWVALVDMTPDNGCLQIVPRSHLAGTLASTESGDGDSHRKVAKDPDYFIPIRMRAGDAVAFTRLTVHGSGPNRTDDPRLAYALQFHREDVKYRVHPADELKLLIENPRTQTPPLEAFEAKK